jgi:peptide/nickel transport system ATP-binding protein
VDVLNNECLLEINNLKTYFYTDEGVSKAVDGVNLRILKGQILGIVGESGCGKSVTAFSIMRLLADPPARIVAGEILFNGQNLLECDDEAMRMIRGKDISMIFQEPMTSLNPVYKIGDQIAEAIYNHEPISREEALKRAVEMLAKVGIPSPEQRAEDYPHQLSGGMRQRVMIAMALSGSPQLLIADEPTTALDVTIQAQILDLIDNLKQKYQMSVLIITHDLGIIAEIANQVAVMYAGKIVEYATVKQLFADPKHPYTQGLMRSIPSLDKRAERLNTIPGIVPSALNFPPGCRFHERCPVAGERCRTEEPELVEVEKGHTVGCWYLK